MQYTSLLGPNEHEWWCERAAVREYDWGMPRAEAEFRAWLELLDRVHDRLSARITARLGHAPSREG